MTDQTPHPEPEQTPQAPQTPPPPPQPGGETPPAGSTSSEGLDPKVGGLLSYLLFGWIGGLIMYLTQKHPEVRFHGAQSILFSIALFVIFVALAILGTIFGLIPGIGFIGTLITLVLYPILWLGSVVLWVFLCIKGYNLDHFKLPMIGDMAEKWAAK